MKKTHNLALAVCLLCTFSCAEQKKPAEQPVKETKEGVRLVTVDPGHFHAALVQKRMYETVAKDVHVYSPKGPDLDLHLARISSFNSRAEEPTAWNEKVYTGDDFFEKMITEKKGNVVVLSGNNQKKTAYIKRAVENGFHVLSDKPMVIHPDAYDDLVQAFEIAKKNNVVLYDIMTERYECTTMLQKYLAHTSSVFGQLIDGTPDKPAVTKESVHHFSKLVAGKQLIRPDWFFDTTQQGEGMVDVTTHLVDLVQWECFPEQIIKKEDIKIVSADRWPTKISAQEFKEVTGKETFSNFLQPSVKDEVLNCYANGEINYTIRGKHAKVRVEWRYKAPEGAKDTHYSIMRGTDAELIIKQGKEENYKPVLYVQDLSGRADFIMSLQEALAKSDCVTPGTKVEEVKKGMAKLIIPEKFHNGHEAHFGQVTEKYLGFLEGGKMPEWEIPNILTKYYTTMEAYKLAH